MRIRKTGRALGETMTADVGDGREVLRLAKSLLPVVARVDVSMPGTNRPDRRRGTATLLKQCEGLGTTGGGKLGGGSPSELIYLVDRVKRIQRLSGIMALGAAFVVPLSPAV